MYKSETLISDVDNHAANLGASVSMYSGALQGDLSLLADKGHAGLPMGHTIAYKADHELHVEFAKKLKASCKPSDVVSA